MPTRGYMAYAGAIGEEAALAAVQYVVRAHEALASEEPPLVLDPFCGQGTVIALANAHRCDTMGMDIHRGRCATAVARRPQPEDCAYPLCDHYGRALGTMRYWECV